MILYCNKYTTIALPKISITFQIKEIYSSGIMASVSCKLQGHFLTLKEILREFRSSRIYDESIYLENVKNKCGRFCTENDVIISPTKILAELCE